VRKLRALALVVADATYAQPWVSYLPNRCGAVGDPGMRRLTAGPRVEGLLVEADRHKCTNATAFGPPAQCTDVGRHVSVEARTARGGS